MAHTESKATLVCKICHKTFRGKTNNLTRHMREQHEQFIKKMKCPKCGYLSQWRKNVRKHLKDVHHVRKLPDLSNLQTVQVLNESKCITHGITI